jgi:uncharacterized membrane protein required for colicin V production
MFPRLPPPQPIVLQVPRDARFGPGPIQRLKAFYVIALCVLLAQGAMHLALYMQNSQTTIRHVGFFCGLTLGVVVWCVGLVWCLRLFQETQHYWYTDRYMMPRSNSDVEDQHPYILARQGSQLRQRASRVLNEFNKTMRQRVSLLEPEEA